MIVEFPTRTKTIKQNLKINKVIIVVDSTEKTLKFIQVENKLVTINQTEDLQLNLIVQDDVLNDGVKRSKGKHTDSGSGSGGIWQESTSKPAEELTETKDHFLVFTIWILGGNHKYINCPKVFKRLFLL